MRRQGCNSNGEVMSSFYAEHDPVYADIGGASLTRQEFAEECDVNLLMERYEKTGVISHVNTMPAQYFDASAVPDYQGALQQIRDAEAAFAALPARARATFDNDAAAFVEFAQDPANIDQMRSWGLAEAERLPDPPMKVEVINPPSEPAKGS